MIDFWSKFIFPRLENFLRENWPFISKFRKIWPISFLVENHQVNLIFYRNCLYWEFFWGMKNKKMSFRAKKARFLKTDFFRNSQKFGQFRSEIRSNDWVPSSTVQLRKYVEREFKMRLMIALIKFSRVKFEIWNFFLQILIFWCHVSNTCWSESECENFF